MGATHEIGIVVLMTRSHRVPEGAGVCPQASKRPFRDEAERRCAGNRPRAGGRLAGRTLGTPNELVEVIASHHAPALPDNEHVACACQRDDGRLLGPPAARRTNRPFQDYPAPRQRRPTSSLLCLSRSAAPRPAHRRTGSCHRYRLSSDSPENCQFWKTLFKGTNRLPICAGRAEEEIWRSTDCLNQRRLWVGDEPHQRHVLIVDDDDLVRETLRFVLEEGAIRSGRFRTRWTPRRFWNASR